MGGNHGGGVYGVRALWRNGREKRGNGEEEGGGVKAHECAHSREGRGRENVADLELERAAMAAVRADSRGRKGVGKTGKWRLDADRAAGTN